MRALANTQAAAGTLFDVYGGYALFFIYRYGIIRAYRHAVSKSKAGIGALLITTRKLSRRFTGLYPGVFIDSFRIAATMYKSLFIKG